jgi:hypothetical protein
MMGGLEGWMRLPGEGSHPAFLFLAAIEGWARAATSARKEFVFLTPTLSGG